MQMEQSMKETFKNGKREGEGKLIYPSGKLYVGSFKDGFIHGKGKEFFKDGYSYNGDWVKGLKHGLGVLKSQRDSRNEGGFLMENIPDKYKDLSWYNLFRLDDSGWVEDKINGLTYIYEANEWIFTGEVKNNKLQGKSTKIYLWGIQRSGKCGGNYLEGVATFTDLEGNEKKGEWKNDEFIRWIG